MTKLPSNLNLADLIAMARAWIEFEDDFIGYCTAHQHKENVQSLQLYYQCKLAYETIGITDDAFLSDVMAQM